MRFFRYLKQIILFIVLITILISCGSRNLTLRSIVWILKSRVIARDVGKIKKILPIGESCSCAFGDGCSCELRFQIEGENDKINSQGVLEMRSVFVDFWSGKLYFSVGIWHENDKEIKIHPSDMTYEDYYAPPHYLEVLNNQIAQTPYFSSLYYQRAQTNLLLNNQDSAYKDIQMALNLLRQTASKSQIKINYRSQREYQRVLAIIQLEVGKFEQAMQTIERLLASSPQPDLEIGRDYLFRWLIQNYAGKATLANQMLAEARRSQSKSLVSFKKVTKIFLNEKNSVDCQTSVGYSYYIGHKLYIDGKYSQARNCFQQFLRSTSVELPDSQRLLTQLILKKSLFVGLP